jgi:beta-lactamase superfamily II metal-dependent hydrolase
VKLHIFQSDKGDCLLLESRDKQLVLCDGGMAVSMRSHVRAELAKLRAAKRSLAYVYVSHIDSDHISGVLQLLEDAVAWRVYELQKAKGTPIPRPDVPRPPEIGGILHNAFRDQVTDNKGAIQNLLAAMAPSLFATSLPHLVDAAHEMEAIATSIPEALQVNGLREALGIPVNQPPGAAGPAKLLLAGQPTDRFAVGTMAFTLLGPTRSELIALRKGWQTWLSANKDTVKKVRTELKRRIDGFSNGTLAGSPFDLSDWNGVPAHEGVSAPNVASLMYLVEEDGKRLLLTGDGQQDFIIDGLERTKVLPKDGGVHLDVLKVQHHGSENNADVEFARRVSARHYVFCGNGEHGNPDARVLRLFAESRLGKKPGVRAAAAPDGEPFTFWFSTTAAAQPSQSDQQDAFGAVEKLVKELVAGSKGQMKARYNKAAKVVLNI